MKEGRNGRKEGRKEGKDNEGRTERIMKERRKG